MTLAFLVVEFGLKQIVELGTRDGHSTVALTLDIYSHVLPQADQEAADRIAALIQ